MPVCVYIFQRFVADSELDSYSMILCVCVAVSLTLVGVPPCYLDIFQQQYHPNSKSTGQHHHRYHCPIQQHHFLSREGRGFRRVRNYSGCGLDCGGRGHGDREDRAPLSEGELKGLNGNYF